MLGGPPELLWMLYRRGKISLPARNHTPASSLVTLLTEPSWLPVPFAFYIYVGAFHRNLSQVTQIANEVTVTQIANEVTVTQIANEVTVTQIGIEATTR
jgi:hypothetical protein